jgi:hypothetical protein
MIIDISSTNPINRIQEILNLSPNIKYKMANGISVLDLDNYPESNDFLLETHIFSNILMYIIKKLNTPIKPLTDSTLCRIDVSEIYHHAIYFDFDKWEIKMPIELDEQIITCIKNNPKLIIIPLHLLINETGHSNILIIMPIFKYICYFEPHGIQTQTDINTYFDTDMVIETYIKQLYPEFKDFNFSNLGNYCPLGLGPQSLQTLYNGHCLAWSLFTIILYIINIYKVIDSTNPDIIENLNESIMEYLTSNDVDTMMRKFFSLIKEIVDKNQINTIENIPELTNYKTIDIKNVPNDKIVSILENTFDNFFYDSSFITDCIYHICQFCKFYNKTFDVCKTFISKKISNPSMFDTFIIQYIKSASFDIELYTLSHIIPIDNFIIHHFIQQDYNNFYKNLFPLLTISPDIIINVLSFYANKYDL